MAPDQTVVQHLAFGAQGGITLLGPHQSSVQVIEAVLEVGDSHIGHIRHWLGRRAGLGDAGLVRGGKRVAVDQGVSRCSSFDLSQACQIAAFEVAVAVLELP